MNIDYTKYPEGCAVSAAGVIVKCPRCGRNGEKRPGGKKYVMRVAHAGQLVSVLPKKGRRRTKLQLVDVCNVEPGSAGA